MVVKTAKYIVLAVFILLSIPVNAQIHNKEYSVQIDADSVRREFDKGPYFTLYKDNYFIFGPSIGPKATKENTNVKFQISVSRSLQNRLSPVAHICICVTPKKYSGIFLKSPCL